MRLLLYARTLRNLRPEQLLYLPLRRVQERLPLPRTGAGLRADPERVARLAAEAGERRPADPEACVRTADEVRAGVFRFLDHAEALGETPPWARRVASHLWSFHLHYFAYGVDLAWAWRLRGEDAYVRRFAGLARGWIAATADGHGDGWAPYALASRILNWTRALLLFGDALDPADRAVVERSLWRQLAVLERRLERHLDANHLQRNHQALAVGALLFSGRDAARWRRRGGKGLWRALREQVLDDGAHYERSPMYHAIALADFLEAAALLQSAGEPVLADALPRLRKMADAFGVLCRPDGRLHLFNDSAEGEAPSRVELDALARRVLGSGIPAPAGTLALTDAGYYGWVSANGAARLLVDCGIPGPRHQPGHAHCDLLSFELDLEGMPVAVDAGVSGYDGDPFREYARSTRAHNTVAVEGREQSEVWGTFRLARRASPAAAALRGDDAGAVFEGACVPYFDRRAVHRRRLEVRACELRVTDRVEGCADAPLESYLHLHPAFDVRREGDAWVAHRPGQRIVVETWGFDAAEAVRGALDPVQGWHLPRFGAAVSAPALVFRVDGNRGAEFGYRIRTTGTAGG